MKAWAVARKTLVEYWREPLLLGLLLVFPILLLLFYELAFGSTDQGLSDYLTVLVDNRDEGRLGVQLVQALESAEYEGQPMFKVECFEYDRLAEAEISLWERKAALLLVIPHDMSATIEQWSGGDAQPVELELVGDLNSANYLFARSLIGGMLIDLADPTGARPLPVSYEFLLGTGTMTDFDFGVPGLIVFGIMFVTVTTAMTLVRENVSGTLRRMRLSRVRAGDLLIGLCLAQMAVALVQVPITLGAAVLMGFKSNGSLLLACAVGLLLSLSAIGLGLLTACLARSDGEAANLGAVIGVMMVLVSGAMYPMPEVPLFTWGGRTFQPYDLMPPAHAAEAMRRVLVLGDGAAAIQYELVALTVLALALLAAGVVLYDLIKLRSA